MCFADVSNPPLLMGMTGGARVLMLQYKYVPANMLSLLDASFNQLLTFTFLFPFPSLTNTGRRASRMGVQGWWWIGTSVLYSRP
jgi:hypothetical protein